MLIVGIERFSDLQDWPRVVAECTDERGLDPAVCQPEIPVINLRFYGYEWGYDLLTYNWEIALTVELLGILS